MDQIPFLARENFNETLGRTDLQNIEDLMPVLKDMIDYAPFASRITAQFVSEAIHENPKIEARITSILQEVSTDLNVMLSRCIFAAQLGARTNIPGIDPVSTLLSSLTLESAEIVKFERVENFYCHSIVQELRCNKRECLIRLSSLPYDCVLDYFLKHQTPYNISLVAHMCRLRGFLASLERRIDEFEMKAEIVALAFTNYFGRGSSNDERAILRRLITGETLAYCLKVCNREELGLVLGSSFEEPRLVHITASEFKAKTFNTTDEFLKAFVELTSPSVTHFFSYFEYYKDRFRLLSGDDKRLLLEQLREFHGDSSAYVDIVVDNLTRFKII